MRYGILIAFFAALTVLTGKFWNGRFVVFPESLQVIVNEHLGNSIRMMRNPGENEKIRCIELPFRGEVDALHIRCSRRAIHLVSGEEEWQCGRMILDWYNEGGQLVGHDTLITVMGNQTMPRYEEMVVRPQFGVFPRLRLEHLGYSGEMRIEGLEITQIRERKKFEYYGSALFIAWGAWLFAFVRMFSNVGFYRRFFCTAILSSMGWFLILPGPWVHIRPILGHFEMGDSATKKFTVEFTDDTNKKANAPESLGKMPVQAGWLFQVKIMLSYLRPILHILLFAGPAFVICALCGSRCASLSLALVAMGVEGVQALLWREIDWLDGIDLLFDGFGIALGIWMLRFIVFHPRFPFKEIRNNCR